MRLVIILALMNIAFAASGYIKGESDCNKGVSLIGAYLTMNDMFPIQSHAYKYRVRQCLKVR